YASPPVLFLLPSPVFHEYRRCGLTCRGVARVSASGPAARKTAAIASVYRSKRDGHHTFLLRSSLVRRRTTGIAGLLRPRRERPRGRAAEQRDEIARAAHSITSSARSRNDSGIVRSRALAVVRLTTRSNLVGCSTGMSAGLLPRRILSTKRRRVETGWRSLVHETQSPPPPRFLVS